MKKFHFYLAKVFFAALLLCPSCSKEVKNASVVSVTGPVEITSDSYPFNAADHSPHRAIQGLFELIPMKEFPMGIQISSDKVIQMVMARKPDAVIIGNAGWGSCAAASGGAAAKLEKLGIPTVIIQRKELMEATRQAVMGQGFAPEAPWVVFNYHLFCWKRRQPS
jgi:ABC-type Fe3+-hydroxamate transport system substrate-binding protein